jgi:predicted ArsR family transcriptional regulator
VKDRIATSVTSVLSESQALGDPSRYAVFEALRSAPDGLLISDLTALIPLHHNAIRAHLATLIESGLVVRERTPVTGRGRPAHTYSLSPEAIARWSATNAHEELSLMLLDLVTSGDSPRDVGRRAGRRLREVVPGATAEGATPSDAVVAVGTELGFDPVTQANGIRLRQCPYAATAAQSREIVCNLHHGIADAVAEGVDPGVRVGLVMHDPYAGRCRFTLTPPPA